MRIFRHGIDPTPKSVEFLGLHPNTLRKYADEGKIETIKNEAGQRLYNVESDRRDAKRSATICYCRVSSTLVRDDLHRQVDFMPERYPDAEIVTDIGSGLNFKIVSVSVAGGQRPTEVQPHRTDNQGRVVALDPGVRTFMTFFSESAYGWLGNDSNLQIQKLCFKLDKLNSKMSKAPSAQKKRFKKATDRLKSKIQHWVKELHHKTSRFLVDNFDVILLPSFESSQMVSKSRRKIRSKTVRQMLTLSHYQFKKHLEWKAWESGKVALPNINEAYTSKTVSWTGDVKEIGGSRVIKDADGNRMNRDLNGARGIFLRALVDTPWLNSHLAV